MPDPLDINTVKPADTTPPPDEKKEDPNKAIMETLTGIKESVDGLGDRIESVENKWDDFEEKTKPTTEDTKEPEFKPQSWDDFPKMAHQKAKEVVEQTFEEKEEEAKKAKEAPQRQQEEVDKEIDEKVGALEKAGKLPPVKNQDDPNDPGRAARRELYGLAAKMDTLNLEQIADTLNTMHKQGLYYDFKSNKYLRRGNSQAGQDAPVGSSGGSSGYGEDKPDYPTIHKARSLSELARRAGM